MKHLLTVLHLITAQPNVRQVLWGGGLFSSGATPSIYLFYPMPFFQTFLSFLNLQWSADSLRNLVGKFWNSSSMQRILKSTTKYESPLIFLTQLYKDSVLTVQLYDWDLLGSDDLIGWQVRHYPKIFFCADLVFLWQEMSFCLSMEHKE